MEQLLRETGRKLRNLRRLKQKLDLQNREPNPTARRKGCNNMWNKQPRSRKTRWYCKRINLCWNFETTKMKTKENNCLWHSPKEQREYLQNQKLLQTNNIFQEKCSQILNVPYLAPELDWVKTHTELEIAYFYKNELHLIERYQKFTSSINKKLKAVTYS